MKNKIIFWFVICTFNLYAQSTDPITFGLQLPDQEYLDSLPIDEFIPQSALELLRSVDLSAEMPTPGNQGKQLSCTAWTIGYALKSYQERVETKNSKIVFSPAFLYNSLQANNSKCTEGIKFTDALNLLKKEGICEWSDMKYSDDNCISKPSKQAKANALKYRIEDWKLIYANQNFSINNRIDDIKKNLHYGRPVAIAVWLDSKLKNVMADTTPNKPKYIWKNPLKDLNKKLNYHAMLCVGYNEDLEEFKVLNSHGTESGNKGYIYISYFAFKTAVYEAYYAIDSDNEGNYVDALKPSSQTAEFGIADSTFNYYGWLKQGYFIRITDAVRLSCAYLKKSKDVVILRLYDTTKQDAKMIGSYKFNSGDSYKITYNGNTYDLKLDKIGSAGHNIFKSAAFINFSKN